MKNNILTNATITACFIISNVMAQAVDSSFNYQGELLDNGVPANGAYDFAMEVVNESGTTQGVVGEYIDISVTNGLFNLDVFVGYDITHAFHGYDDHYLKTSVRKTADAGPYTALNPVQTIQAVPLASNLTNGDATTGQVLTFNGFAWSPSDLPTPETPPAIWTAIGSEINFMDNVGIGVANPAARLQVETIDSGTDPFRVRVGGFTKLWVTGDGNTHLYGETVFQNSTKQSSSKNGQLKYMVNAICTNSGATVYRFYNGTTTIGSVTITPGPSAGRCTINFPSNNINTRYWVTTPDDSSGNRSVTCGLGASNNQLDCVSFRSSDGVKLGNKINILVY